ncbi:MAG: hypothetical protein WCS08_06845 [Eubacteriales bacterium]
MIVEKTCILCSKKVTIEVTEQQFEELQLPRSKRRKVQEILPEHVPYEREMFITGICGDCWEGIYE